MSSPTTTTTTPTTTTNNKSALPSDTTKKLPLLGMLIDRSSFDETDDFCIDQEACQWTDDEDSFGEAHHRVVMRNGKVRRRLRWRPRRLRKMIPSNASVISMASKQSKKSVHSFASTETMVKSNTRKSKNMLFGRGKPLPRPNYPDHYNNGKGTIGTEGGMIQARMGSNELEVILPPSQRKLPPLFKKTPERKKTKVVTPDSNSILPALTDEEQDRQVDLRIVPQSPKEEPVSPTVVSETAAATTPATPTTTTTVLCVDELRQDDDNGSTESKESRTQSSVAPVELEEFTDDEASLVSEESPTIEPTTELRFPMSQAVAERPCSPAESTSSEKARTGPVDVDDGHFLEVEKNLKAIVDVAREHLEQGEYTEALEVFEEILRGQLARYGDTHYRVATAYHNVGIVHTKRCDYPKAISAYKKAVRIRRKTLDKEHPDIAVSLAQLGVAYLESKKNKKAITAFREALKIRRACYGNSHHKVAKILNNIGCALYELNELHVARVAFEEALAIQRELLKGMSVETLASSESQLLSIASTQSNIASIKLYYGEFDDALVDLEEALLVQQCVLPDEHPIVKRGEESIQWVERMRDSNNNGTSKILRSQNSSTSLFDYIERVEQRLMALHSSFDIACGGSGEGDLGCMSDMAPRARSFDVNTRTAL